MTFSNPYDYTKNEYYMNTVELGKNAVSVFQNMYKNKELSGVNAYLSALAIQDITKCNLYEEYDLDWQKGKNFILYRKTQLRLSITYSDYKISV